MNPNNKRKHNQDVDFDTVANIPIKQELCAYITTKGKKRLSFHFDFKAGEYYTIDENDKTITCYSLEKAVRMYNSIHID